MEKSWDINVNINSNNTQNIEIETNNIPENVQQYIPYIEKRNIPESILHNIFNVNMEGYKYAEERGGCPSLLMASIHYSESGTTRLNPSNKQGLYGFLYGNYTAGETSLEEFKEQSFSACEHLQEKSIKANGRKLNKDDKDMEIIGKALWYYNGTAYGNWDKSPYVVAYLYEGSPTRQCAVDFCYSYNTRANLGTYTMFLKLNQLTINK